MKLESLVDPYRPKSRCHPIEGTTASGSFWGTLAWAFRKRSISPILEWRSTRRSRLTLDRKLVEMLTRNDTVGFNENLQRALMHMHASGLGKIPLTFNEGRQAYQLAAALYLTTPTELSAFDILTDKIIKRALQHRLLTFDNS